MSLVDELAVDLDFFFWEQTDSFSGANIYWTVWVLALSCFEHFIYFLKLYYFFKIVKYESILINVIIVCTVYGIWGFLILSTKVHLFFMNR